MNDLSRVVESHTRYPRLLLGVTGGLALLMVVAGVLHFVSPDPFVRIVPPGIGPPLPIVYVSGAFEIIGGFGLLWPRTRRLAAWGAAALFVAVFPANIYMAVAEIQMSPDGTMPVWAMWARLPLQLVLVAAAVWIERNAPRDSAESD